MGELKVGIVGVGGFTGSELVRLVVQHPQLRLTWVAGRSQAGQRLSDVLPQLCGVPELSGLVVQTFAQGDERELARELDVVFCALPHGQSAERAQWLLEAGLQVVDLSADFRLKSAATYERVYGQHPCPDLLEKAVYGQPETHAKELLGARLIAVPGCYPTSVVLPVAPLLKAGLVEPTRVLVDAKSGVSGAGRGKFPYAETSEGIRAYSMGGRHRHAVEMEQELSRAAGAPVRVSFTPHLVPMTRGILSCAYLVPRENVTAEMCRRAAREAYPGGLVSVLEEGTFPDTLWVRGSVRAMLAYEWDEATGTLLAMCVEDNICRGASGQAVQALNVARGWPEALGLPTLGMVP